MMVSGFVTTPGGTETGLGGTEQAAWPVDDLGNQQSRTGPLRVHGRSHEH